MAKFDTLLRDFTGILKSPRRSETKPYDTTATVRRVDGNTVWVSIPGGIDETPVERSIDARAGDTVRVRVSGGRAWITGNNTAPPTDDKEAKNAQNMAQSVGRSVNKLSNAFVENSKIVDSDISNLKAKDSELDNVIARNVEIYDSEISNLKAKDSELDNVIAQNVEIYDSKIEGLTAKDSELNGAIIEHSTILDSHIEKFNVIDGVVDDLQANKADIDLANVNNAWIENGVVKNAAISDAQIIGMSANKLTAGTIDAARINVTNLRASSLVVDKINGQPVLGGYKLVSPESGGYAQKNPSQEGWYEYTATGFVKSTDTTVNTSKSYYQTADSVLLYDQTYIDGQVQNLNQRIDGAIESFTGSEVPTLTNYPASGWSASERSSHVGDVYYVANAASSYDGYCYRFTYDNTSQTYGWVLIKDTDITKALSDILTLQGDVTNIKSFDSEISHWKTETDDTISDVLGRTTSLESEMDEAIADAQYIYISKPSGTYEVAAPSDWIDKDAHINRMYDESGDEIVTEDSVDTVEEGDFQNKWITKRPKYDSQYPIVFIARQLKYKDSHIETTTPFRDDTTTGLEISMATKVDTETFSEVVHSVDENSAKITQLSKRVDTKADNSTVTTVSNTVNTVSQKADSNISKISNITTVLGMNADGTTKQDDVIHRMSSVEQDLSGFKTTVSSTYATNDRVSQAESRITQNADNITTKVSKDGVISSINQSAESVTINAAKVNIAGATIFTTGRLSETSLNNTYAAVNEANGNVQYIYKSVASGSTVTKPDSWITDNSGDQNTWTTKRPQYSSNYPVLYIAKQVKSVAGGLMADLCTNPAIDETTTVIDGGRIITGSIDANAINVSTINITNLGGWSGVESDIEEAGETASAYISSSTIDGRTGIKVSYSTNATSFAHIDRAGFKVISDSTVVGSFGVNQASASITHFAGPYKNDDDSGTTTTYRFNLKYTPSLITNFRVDIYSIASTTGGRTYQLTYDLTQGGSGSQDIRLGGLLVGHISRSWSGRNVYLTLAREDNEIVFYINVTVTYNAVSDNLSSIMIGQYGNNNNQLFCIGNGFSSSETSNAFSVDFNGNTKIDGNVTISSALTNNNIPGYDIYERGYFINDINNVRLGFLRAFSLTNGQQGIQITAAKTVSGTEYASSAYLYVDKDNINWARFSGRLYPTKGVYLDDGSSIKIDNDTLFKRSSFTKQNITLGTLASGFYSGSFNIEESGYTPVAIAGWNVDNSASGGALGTYIMPYEMYVKAADNTAHYGIRNTSTSGNAKIDFTLVVLYIRKELVSSV